MVSYFFTGLVSPSGLVRGTPKLPGNCTFLLKLIVVKDDDTNNLANGTPDKI